MKLGGRHGISNPSLVESAIGRPYSGYYRSIQRKAAALVESMANNHGFADGNKRTTIILLHTLLTKSGYRLRPATPDENIEDATEAMILSVVTKRLSLDATGAWFDRRIEKV